MSAVDTQQLSATDARELTDTIRRTGQILWSQVTRAFRGRAWVALGYESWDEYCAEELDCAQLKLPRAERETVVASLRDAGLSMPAIAAATGASVGTVHADLSRLSELKTSVPQSCDADHLTNGEAISPPAEPATTTGIDGKTYPKSKPPKPAPEAYDILVDAGLQPAIARRLVDNWEKWPQTDPLTEARKHAANLLADVVAICPFCRLQWNHTTDLSWWLHYDRCYACMRSDLGIDRVPSADEMRRFELPAEPATAEPTTTATTEPVAPDEVIAPPKPKGKKDKPTAKEAFEDDYVRHLKRLAAAWPWFLGLDDVPAAQRDRILEQLTENEQQWLLRIDGMTTRPVKS